MRRLRLIASLRMYDTRRFDAEPGSIAESDQYEPRIIQASLNTILSTTYGSAPILRRHRSSKLPDRLGRDQLTQAPGQREMYVFLTHRLFDDFRPATIPQIFEHFLNDILRRARPGRHKY